MTMWLVGWTAAYLVIAVVLAVAVGKFIKFGMGGKGDGADRSL
jgi:Na+(H+)/acetate symporter ActP